MCSIAHPTPPLRSQVGDKYAESHWKYHTFDGYYKLRHKAHQMVLKCSLTFPLRNGIVIFYENCTNNMLQSINWGWYPWVPLVSKVKRLNVMGHHNNFLKSQHFIPDAKSVISNKP